MRALSCALAGLAALSLVAACSKQDQSHASYDAKDAANSLAAEAKEVGHSPEWKRVAADVKGLGHVAGNDLRKGAAEAEGATNSVVADAKHGAHQGGERQDQRNKDRDSGSSS